MRAGLLCLIAGAVLWVAPAAYAQPGSVQAGCGSVGIGGSSVATTITVQSGTCGLPPEQLEALRREWTRDLRDLSEERKQLIALLQGKLELNQRQVRAALGILGEAEVPPDQLAAKLVEVAERFKALQTTAAAQPGDDPKVAALTLQTFWADAAEQWRATTTEASARSGSGLSSPPIRLP